MPKKKTKAKRKKKKKKHNFAFTTTGLFFWSIGFVLLLAWIFVLGILVGRGLLPGIDKNSEQKASLNHLLEDSENRQKRPLEPPKKLRDEPQLAFYKELSTKKAEAAKKSQTNGNKQKRKEQTPKKQQENKPASNKQGKYVLQLASLQMEQKAMNLRNKLVKKGFPAYVSKTTVKEKAYFRVRCGPFLNKEDAVRTKKILEKNEGISGGFVAKIGQGAN
jgi:cell division protein FtsN